MSMQWATQANEAYQTLKNPLSRARYLLHLHGVDIQEESNTAMSAEFLMEQMEWREAIMEAKEAQDATDMEALAPPPARRNTRAASGVGAIAGRAGGLSRLRPGWCAS